MSKWFFLDLWDGAKYWLLGKSTGYFSYISVEDRLEELKQKVWRLYRRLLRCPLGTHYIKWNSGDPSCIICWRRHREIFPKDKE